MTKTQTKASMDLANFDTVKAAEEGAAIPLRHPVTSEVLIGTDEKPVEIYVVGSDSKAWRDAMRRSIEKRLAKSRRSGRNTQQQLNSEEIEEESIALLAGATTGWTNNFVLRGEKFPFSTENAKLLYREFPAFREQIDQAVADRANFLKS